MTQYSTIFGGPDHLQALRTTVLDCPDHPDGPAVWTILWSRTVQDRTVQISWVRTVPILLVRASPSVYFIVNTTETNQTLVGTNLLKIYKNIYTSTFFVRIFPPQTKTQTQFFNFNYNNILKKFRNIIENLK